MFIDKLYKLSIPILLMAMKKYSKLKLETRSRIASELEKVHKAGSTLPLAKRMTPSEYRTLIGSKAKLKTIESYQRLLRQASATKERREGSITIALKSYKKFGFKGAGLEKIEKELVKVSGNTFSAISDDLQKEYPNMDLKDIYKKTRELLAIPESEYDKLDQPEREIIERYGFDTP